VALKNEFECELWVGLTGQFAHVGRNLSNTNWLLVGAIGFEPMTSTV
jgi:hypothetical protein